MIFAVFTVQTGPGTQCQLNVIAGGISRRNLQSQGILTLEAIEQCNVGKIIFCKTVLNCTFFACFFFEQMLMLSFVQVPHFLRKQLTIWCGNVVMSSGQKCLQDSQESLQNCMIIWTLLMVQLHSQKAMELLFAWIQTSLFILLST